MSSDCSPHVGERERNRPTEEPNRRSTNSARHPKAGTSRLKICGHFPAATVRWPRRSECRAGVGSAMAVRRRRSRRFGRPASGGDLATSNTQNGSHPPASSLPADGPTTSSTTCSRHSIDELCTRPIRLRRAAASGVSWAFAGSSGRGRIAVVVVACHAPSPGSPGCCRLLSFQRLRKQE